MQFLGQENKQNIFQDPEKSKKPFSASLDS